MLFKEEDSMMYTGEITRWETSASITFLSRFQAFAVFCMSCVTFWIVFRRMVENNPKVYTRHNTSCTFPITQSIDCRFVNVVEKATETRVFAKWLSLFYTQYDFLVASKQISNWKKSMSRKRPDIAYNTSTLRFAIAVLRLDRRVYLQMQIVQYIDREILLSQIINGDILYTICT
jgi:hypothetical protein